MGKMGLNSAALVLILCFFLRGAALEHEDLKFKLQINNWQLRKTRGANVADIESESTSLSEKQSNSSPYLVARGRKGFRSVSEQDSDIRVQKSNTPRESEIQNSYLNTGKLPSEFSRNKIINRRSFRQRNNNKGLEENLNTERQKIKKNNERLRVNNFRNFKNYEFDKEDSLPKEILPTSKTLNEKNETVRENLDTNPRFQQRLKPLKFQRGHLKFKDTAPLGAVNDEISTKPLSAVARERSAGKSKESQSSAIVQQYRGASVAASETTERKIPDQQLRRFPQIGDLRFQRQELAFTHENPHLQSSLRFTSGLNEKSNSFLHTSSIPEQKLLFFNEGTLEAEKDQLQKNGESLKKNNDGQRTTISTLTLQNEKTLESPNTQQKQNFGHIVSGETVKKVVENEKLGLDRNQIERRIDRANEESPPSRNLGRVGDDLEIKSETQAESSIRQSTRRSFRQDISRKVTITQPSTKEPETLFLTSTSPESRTEENSWRNAARKRLEKAQAGSTKNLPSLAAIKKVDRIGNSAPKYTKQQIVLTSLKPSSQKTEVKEEENFKVSLSKSDDDIDESANYPKEFLEKLRNSKHLGVSNSTKNSSRKESSSGTKFFFPQRTKNNSDRHKRNQTASISVHDEKKSLHPDEKFLDRKETETIKFATTSKVATQRFSQRVYKKLAKQPRTSTFSAVDAKPVGTEQYFRVQPVARAESEFLSPLTSATGVPTILSFNNSEEGHKFMPKKKISKEERKLRVVKLREKLKKNITEQELKPEESKESLVVQANDYPSIRLNISKENAKSEKEDNPAAFARVNGSQTEKVASKGEGYDLISLGSEENVRKIFVGQKNEGSSSAATLDVPDTSTPPPAATVPGTPPTPLSTTQPDFALLNVTLFPSTRHRFSARINSTVRTNAQTDLSVDISTTASSLPEVSENLSVTEKNLNSSLRVNLLNSSISASSKGRTAAQISLSDSVVKASTGKSIDVSSSSQPTEKTSVRSTTKRSKKKSSRKKSGKKSKNKGSTNGTTTVKPPRTTTLKLNEKSGQSEATVRLGTGNFTAAGNNNSVNVQPLSLAFSQIQSIINETIEVVNSNPMSGPSYGVIPRSELNALTPETIINSGSVEEATEETTDNPKTTTPTITNINDNSTNQAGSSRNMSSGVECINGTCKNSLSQLVYFNESNLNMNQEPLPYARMRGTTKSPEKLRNIFIYGIFSNNTVQKKPFPGLATTVEKPTSSATSPPYTAGDYYVFGVYPNNSVVRRRGWKTFDYEKYRSPYVIFGIYPNNTIIKKYPNGTTINDDFMVSDNEIQKSFTERKICKPCSNSGEKQTATDNFNLLTSTKPTTKKESESNLNSDTKNVSMELAENDEAEEQQTVTTELESDTRTTTTKSFTTDEAESESEETDETDENEEDEIDEFVSEKPNADFIDESFGETTTETTVESIKATTAEFNDESIGATSTESIGDSIKATTTETPDELIETTTKRATSAQESLMEAEEADNVSTPRAEELTTTFFKDLTGSDQEALKKAEDADNASTPQNCLEESTNENLTDVDETSINNLSEFTTDNSKEEYLMNAEKMGETSKLELSTDEAITFQNENTREKTTEKVESFFGTTEKPENLVGQNKTEEESFLSKTTESSLFDWFTEKQFDAIKTTEKLFNVEDTTTKFGDSPETLRSRTTVETESVSEPFESKQEEITEKSSEDVSGVDSTGTTSPTESNHWQSFVTDLFGTEKTNNLKSSDSTTFDSEKLSLKNVESTFTTPSPTTEGNFRIDLGFELRGTEGTSELNLISTTTSPFEFDVRQIFDKNESTPVRSTTTFSLETTTSRTPEENTTQFPKLDDSPSKLTSSKENDNFLKRLTTTTEISSAVEITTNVSPTGVEGYFYDTPTGNPFDVNEIFFGNLKTNIFGTGTERPSTLPPYLDGTTFASEKSEVETTRFPNTDYGFEVDGSIPGTTSAPPKDENSATRELQVEATTSDDLLNALLPLSLDFVQGAASGNSLAKRHRKSVDLADAEPSSLTNLAYRALSSSNPTSTPLPILTTTKREQSSSSRPRVKKKKIKNLSKTTVTAYKNLTSKTSTVAPDDVFIVTPEATTRGTSDSFDGSGSTDASYYSKRGKVKFVTLTPGVLVTTNIHDENDILTMSSQHVQKVTKAPAKIPDNFLSTVFGDIEEKASSPIPDILKNVENDIQEDNLSVSLAKRIITLALEKAMTSTTQLTGASPEPTTSAYHVGTTTDAPNPTTLSFEMKSTTDGFSTVTRSKLPSYTAATSVQTPTTSPKITTTRKPRATSTSTTPKATTTSVTTTTPATTTVPTPETILITPKKLVGDYATTGDSSDRSQSALALDPLTLLLSGRTEVTTTSSTSQKVTEDLNILLSNLWENQKSQGSEKTQAPKTSSHNLSRKPTKEGNNSWPKQASATLSSGDLKILEAILQQQGTGAGTQDLQQIVQNQIRLAEEIRKASRNLKKKQRSTTTTTTENPSPLGLGFLLNLFGSGSRPNILSESRSPKRQRPFFALDNGSSPTPDPFNELEGTSTTAERSARGELVSAAIDVTKAVSKFMGTVLSSAAQSFQNFFRSFGR